MVHDSLAPTLLGYRLFAKVPPAAPHTRIPTPGERRLLVGTDRGPYLLPPGIDPLELGLIPATGHYELLPIDINGDPRRNDAVHLLISEDQLRTQRSIWKRSYDALLDLLPHDAGEIDREVQLAASQGVPHPFLELLSRATIETWACERVPFDPLDEPERERLHRCVATRTVMLIRLAAPPCRLDLVSMRALTGNLAGVLLDRIDVALSQGDPTDATARALARIRMGLHLPAEWVAAVLPHVRRLDIAFALLRNANRPLDVLSHLAPSLMAGTEEMLDEAFDGGLVIRTLFALYESRPPDIAAGSPTRT